MDPTTLFHTYPTRKHSHSDFRHKTEPHLGKYWPCKNSTAQKKRTTQKAQPKALLLDLSRSTLILRIHTNAGENKGVDAFEYHHDGKKASAILVPPVGSMSNAEGRLSSFLPLATAWEK